MPARRDLFSDGTLAHTSLQGHAEAKRFLDGALKRIAKPAARLHLDPKGSATDRQVLYGHKICQLDPFQPLSRDETTGYVGYIADQDTATWAEPTHRVSARATLIFAEPTFKSPNPVALSCGSHIRVIGTEGRFARSHDGRYIPQNHLTDLTVLEPDLAATAEQLLGTPYLWGGNSAFGIDCSGLIQLACQAAQIPCPGDSDQQMHTLGADVPQGTPPKRNDLMFWKGHVALVCDPGTIIHANAYHMAVAYEPIQTALTRIEEQGDGPLLAHKRL